MHGVSMGDCWKKGLDPFVDAFYFLEKLGISMLDAVLLKEGEVLITKEQSSSSGGELQGEGVYRTVGDYVHWEEEPFNCGRIIA